MADSTVRDGRDILRFHLGVTEDWHEVPLRAEEGAEWANRLTTSLLPAGGPAAVSLEYQLSRVHANLSAMDLAGLTAAVWVPVPETGYVSSACGFRLSDLAEEDTPDRILADLEADRGREVDGSTFVEVDTWRGQVPVGSFVAARNLLAHPQEDEAESWIEERAVFAVFPTGANQAVQIFFSAESISAYWDIAAQTEAVVATLQVELQEIP
jgi:hypothetical protein